MINVDRIVTISLKNREDRRNVTQTELAKLNLLPNFFLVERDPENGERGCFNSHVNVIKQARNEGCKSILVFEDDVKILPYSQKQIESVNKFLQGYSHRFDILFLGFILGQMWYCGRKGIVRAMGSASHAYIVSQRGMEKIAKLQYAGIAIDEVLKQFKCYSVYPMIAEQYSESIMASDLTPFRTKVKKRRVHDEDFWKSNFAKQKRRLWGNFHRTIKDFFCFNL